MSKKHEYYCWCEMKKNVPGGVKVDMAWIPEKFAQIDKYIKIKQNDGTWEDGWKVTYVGGRREVLEVLAGERDYLNQRKVSDR